MNFMEGTRSDAESKPKTRY